MNSLFWFKLSFSFKSIPTFPTFSNKLYWFSKNLVMLVTRTLFRNNGRVRLSITLQSHKCNGKALVCNVVIQIDLTHKGQTALQAFNHTKVKSVTLILSQVCSFFPMIMTFLSILLISGIIAYLVLTTPTTTTHHHVFRLSCVVRIVLPHPTHTHL